VYPAEVGKETATRKPQDDDGAVRKINET